MRRLHIGQNSSSEFAAYENHASNGLSTDASDQTLPVYVTSVQEESDVQEEPDVQEKDAFAPDPATSRLNDESTFPDYAADYDTSLMDDGPSLLEYHSGPDEEPELDAPTDLRDDVERHDDSLFDRQDFQVPDRCYTHQPKPVGINSYEHKVQPRLFDYNKSIQSMPASQRVKALRSFARKLVCRASIMFSITH